MKRKNFLRLLLALPFVGTLLSSETGKKGNLKWTKENKVSFVGDEYGKWQVVNVPAFGGKKYWLIVDNEK